MISPVDGGIKIPNVPPAATAPVAKLSPYLKRFISGSATRPMVTAEAIDEPLKAAKPAQPEMVALARPPRQWPTQEYAALNKSRLIPDTPAKFPIKTNKGITVSVRVTEISKLSVPKAVSAAVYPFIAAVPKKPTTSIAIATGTLRKSRPKRAKSPIKPIAVTDTLLSPF